MNEIQIAITKLIRNTMINAIATSNKKQSNTELSIGIALLNTMLIGEDIDES